MRTDLGTWVAVAAMACSAALYAGPGHADCLADVEALDQEFADAQPRGSGESTAGTDDRAGGETSKDAKAETSNDAEAQEREETVQAEGPAVVEGGGVTTYAEGGPAAPAENWFGKKGMDGKAIEAQLIAAKDFAREGDEEACRDALAEARAMLGR